MHLYFDAVTNVYIVMQIKHTHIYIYISLGINNGVVDITFYLCQIFLGYV